MLSISVLIVTIVCYDRDQAGLGQAQQAQTKTDSILDDEIYIALPHLRHGEKMKCPEYFTHIKTRRNIKDIAV